MISEAEYARMREEMVHDQLIRRGISDPKTLTAFRKVPRHLFIREEMRSHAYSDYPVPIGFNQTISQPYMVALMTELLELKGGEKVLEIGTGSGYQLAILAEMAGSVYSVERFADLAETSKSILLSLGYKNFKIKIGDGTLGWEEESPYDAIVVTAGAPHIPKHLTDQLKDGGRLVMPVGGGLGQILIRGRKTANIMKTEDICPCTFVPLVGKEGWPSDGF